MTGLLIAASTASAQSPDFIFTAGEASGSVGTTVTIPVQLDVLTVPTQGWSFSLCHDPSIATPVAVVEGDAEVELFFAEVLPEGVHCLVLADFFPPFGDTVPPGFYVALEIDYSLKSPGTSDLVFCDSVGDPPTETVVVVEGQAVIPTTISGSLMVEEPVFLRGDADGDGIISGLVDGLFLLSFQFIPGSPAPPCDDAADVNDDGSVNGLVDGLFLLNFQFVGGSPPPPDPGPIDCGVDPSDDGLACEVYDGC